jgi:Fe2+ or Zn2+ uptake regulation protein
MTLAKAYSTEFSNSLIELFTYNHLPLSFSNIQNLLKEKSVAVNKTTIYRQLEKLVQTNFLVPIDGANGRTWEKVSSPDHAHLTCNLCNKIVCLTVNYKTQIAPIENENNIKIIKFTLSGICQNCL